MYIQTAGIRMYAGNSLTFVAPDGYNITGIKLSGETGFDTNLTAEGLSNGTWTGEASEVVIAGNSNKKNITAATITLAKQSSVKVPVFSIPSGTYYGPQTVELTCATEDATIQYSTDGETWIDYKSAITISETTTLYAKAVKGEDESAVVNATYTFPKVYTLGEMNAQSAGKYNVKFDKAVVTYVNGRFVFIEDATGAILFYNENKYAAKQVLDGIASVTWTLYSGQREATAITEVEGATFTTDGTVESVSPKVVTLAKLLEDKDAYISRFIKVEHVNAEASDKISQGDCELAFYGRNKAAVETGNIYDITGFLGIHQDEDADIYQLVAYTPDHVTEIPTVAQVGTQKYETLEEAWAEVKDGETIKLLADCEGNGLIAPQGKFTSGLIVDFNGKTYSVTGNLVGSTGTESQAFQLLKENKITFKNGTITSAKAKILIQNYSDLTLEGMTLTMNNANYASAYTLSNNNGNIVIDGTTINANPAGGFAFDVCRYSSYPSVNVTVKGESVINGNVEVFASGSDAKDGFKLMLEAGKLNGNIVLDASAKAAMAATPEKTLVMKSETFTTDAPADYKWVAAEEGTLKLVPCEYVAQIGEGENVKKFETLEAAFAAANDGETITVLADCAGNGIVTPQGKFTTGLTVDFGGHKYTVDGATVGSTGTETNGFQLLKDNKITFQNGTITSEKAKILIQNYSDLTLKGMTLTLNKEGYTSAYTLSNNNGNIVIDGTTINANPAGGFAFDVCRYSSYPSVNVTVKGESVINGNVEVFASGSDAKDGFKLMLEAGTLNGNIVLDASAAAAMESTPDKVSITKADAFAVEAPAGYEWANNGDGTSTLQPVAPVVLSAPIIFHDSGEYESELQIAMTGEGTIMYTLNDGEAQTYSAPFTIRDEGEYIIKAWAVKDGVASDVTEPKTFTIKKKAKSAVVEDGYYTIQTNDDDGKYVNVAGRKTVTLVSDMKSAGTVIRVKADEDGVKVLRSQAVDLPRYAERAMSYVPEIVKEVVKKLAANVDDPIIGEQGADLILDKFKKEFDYHLYLEGENNTYRIYGRTPSMKPVVDFYAENKELVDSRLPKVEKFVKEVLQEIVNKVGRGQSVVDMFKVKTIWEKMGGKLTDPDVDQAKFFEEVLSSEKNTWEFAYQTGMLYWEKVKGYLTDNISELGDYGKYIEKIPQIRPNFRYYIVPGENGVDIISEGNSQITDASTAWTLTKREGFDVTFDATLSKNNGKEMYKTLYVDFGYKLPDGVTALKVTAIDENTGVAKTEEIGQEVAPQTPVLLKSDKAGDITLTIGDNFGSAVTDNQLVGADYLINKYEINTPQVESIFTLLANLSKSLANEYSYLKRKNAGTVNNKYFFGLTKDDLKLCYYLNDNEEKDCVVRSLSMGDEKLGFYNNWTAKANEAFLVSEQFNPVKLTLKGDVNRDGSITIADVTALVNIILGKATYPADADKYDFEAAHVNADEDITIADVTALVNIILGK